LGICGGRKKNRGGGGGADNYCPEEESVKAAQEGKGCINSEKERRLTYRQEKEALARIRREGGIFLISSRGRERKRDIQKKRRKGTWGREGREGNNFLVGEGL